MKSAVRWIVPVAVLAVFGLASCQSAYFLIAKEPKKKVAAECDKLTGKRVAIVVWTDQATLDEDYAARFRVADSIRYYLSRDVKDIKLVDIREVVDFQEQGGNDWESMTNAEMAQKFKADFVLRADVLEYTTRARDSREIRKGRVRATVAIHPSDGTNDAPAYSTEIVASYPADAKTDVLNLSDTDIINGALRIFGEKVAQKFHEHEASY